LTGKLKNLLLTFELEGERRHRGPQDLLLVSGETKGREN